MQSVEQPIQQIAALLALLSAFLVLVCHACACICFVLILSSRNIWFMWAHQGIITLEIVHSVTWWFPVTGTITYRSTRYWELVISTESPPDIHLESVHSFVDAARHILIGQIREISINDCPKHSWRGLTFWTGWPRNSLLPIVCKPGCQENAQGLLLLVDLASGWDEETECVGRGVCERHRVGRAEVWLIQLYTVCFGIGRCWFYLL